jgi:hypothetical protein
MTKLEGKQVTPWHFDAPHLYTYELLFNDLDIYLKSKDLD